MARRALICGISGQDGSYLAKLLLDRGYEVWGGSRSMEPSRFTNLHRLGIAGEVRLVPFEGASVGGVVHMLRQARPDSVFNLAGQSSVGLSFEHPVETMKSIAMATFHLLEGIRVSELSLRFFNAGSTECFGNTGNNVANEETELRPASPYAIAKASAYWTVMNYRSAYKIYACTGILANHESPLRPAHFVTSKIIHAVAQLALGRKAELTLGNLAVERDWGWAPEFVEAIALLLEQPEAEDYIIATGVSHTLTEFVSTAFELVARDWREHTIIEERLIRPTDVETIKVNPSKIARRVGWKARLHMAKVIGKLLESEMEQIRHDRTMGKRLRRTPPN
jgi:GDPmannose 4,6-dehydratase